MFMCVCAVTALLFSSSSSLQAAGSRHVPCSAQARPPHVAHLRLTCILSRRVCTLPDSLRGASTHSRHPPRTARAAATAATFHVPFRNLLTESVMPWSPPLPPFLRGLGTTLSTRLYSIASRGVMYSGLRTGGVCLSAAHYRMRRAPNPGRGPRTGWTKCGHTARDQGWTTRMRHTGRRAPLHIIVQLLDGVAGGLGEDLEVRLVLRVRLAPADLHLDRLPRARLRHLRLLQHGGRVLHHEAPPGRARTQQHRALPVRHADTHRVDLHAGHRSLLDLIVKSRHRSQFTPTNKQARHAPGS